MTHSLTRHDIYVLLNELQVASYFACISPENTSKYEQQMLEIKDKIMDAFDAKDTEIRMLLGADILPWTVRIQKLPS